MRVRSLFAGLAACCALGAIASAQAPAPLTASREAPRAPGYLAPAAIPQVDRIIPPPPAEGSERQRQDFETFKATRQMEGSARWRLARDDNSYTVPYLLQSFSCAAGVQLTPQNAPRTADLIGRMLRDTGATSASAKDVFKRKRPYLYVDGPICIDKTDSLAASPDYPSGHSTLGFSVGLVLAELMPERSTEILTRGRAYGESRVVCGVHSVSAVQAGWATAASAVAALHGSTEFRADLEAARRELAALRNSGAQPVGDVCLAETALISRPPY